MAQLAIQAKRQNGAHVIFKAMALPFFFFFFFNLILQPLPLNINII